MKKIKKIATKWHKVINKALAGESSKAKPKLSFWLMLLWATKRNLSNQLKTRVVIIQIKSRYLSIIKRISLNRNQQWLIIRTSAYAFPSVIVVIATYNLMPTYASFSVFAILATVYLLFLMPSLGYCYYSYRQLIDCLYLSLGHSLRSGHSCLYYH